MRAPLPDLARLDIEALRTLILEQHEEQQRQQEELARQRAALDEQLTLHQAELLARIEQIEQLKLVVEKLRRMLFGRKSEKLSAQLEQLELELEEVEAVHAAVSAATHRRVAPTISLPGLLAGRCPRICRARSSPMSPGSAAVRIAAAIFGELSAGVHRSETVSLEDPVMPVLDRLAG